MVVVASWLILRWLHQRLWPREEVEVVSERFETRDEEEEGDVEKTSRSSSREFDLMLAPPPRRLRVPGSCLASLQNAENELRRRRKEEEKRTKRSNKGAMEEEERQRDKELARLQAEVKSLEVVVEMRTEEVRRLRRQLEGREREEEEEVETLWSRVSRMALEEKEGAKMRVVATQTEGYGNCKSQGAETVEDEVAITKIMEKERELVKCKKIGRSREVTRGRDEDRFSLESGYFTHSDEETNSNSSSPIPEKERSENSSKKEGSQTSCEINTDLKIDLDPKCDIVAYDMVGGNMDLELEHKMIDTMGDHKELDEVVDMGVDHREVDNIVDRVDVVEDVLEIEDKPKKSIFHERRPSRFLI